MAQLNNAYNGHDICLRKKAGVQRMKKHYLKIDMTPMVDLGFLLISFFVITTELSKPTVMDLAMPKDGPPVDLGESGALTVLTRNDKVFCYVGKWNEALAGDKIIYVSLSGNHSLREVIHQQQIKLDTEPGFREGRNGLMLLIKPGENTSYKTIIDLLDEATISMVKKYVLLPQTNEEKNWLGK
jgi:biopolymer transport protein ExbD